MSEVLISVIIPHHRDGISLVSAVQSAVAQTFAPFEIIVVNDDVIPLPSGLVQRLEASTFGLRILELNCCSGSPAYPRNIAIAESRGNYIAFLDADDLWLNGHLQRMLQIWRYAPEAIVHGHQLCWGQSLDRPFFQAGLSTRATPQSTFRQLLRFGNTIFTSSLGAPAELVKRYKFQPDLLWEDFDLWLRLAADGHYFINSNSCSTLYQIREGSRSGRREARSKGAQQLVDKYFRGRPLFLLPPWLLRNLYF